MESILQAMASSLNGCTTERSSFEAALQRMNEIRAMTGDDWREAVRAAAQRKMDAYNSTPGHLNDEDGYDCRLCLNRGDTGVLREYGGGINECFPECRCMEIRRSIRRMKASGLETAVRECTFKRFRADEPWQEEMLNTAKRYLEEGWQKGAWLYMGGAVGCGKTHICTAVAGKLLYERPLLYEMWPQASKKIKALSMDAQGYEKEIQRLQRIPVLYMDDLFKPVRGAQGEVMMPSGPDVKIAFEVLNYRYVNRMPTILSSEWHLAELTDIDEATGSRIAERCRGFCVTVGRDRRRNQRLKGEKVV